jgi:hypothetical protein
MISILISLFLGVQSLSTPFFFANAPFFTASRCAAAAAAFPAL